MPTSAPPPLSPVRPKVRDGRYVARRLSRKLFRILELDDDGPLVGPAALAALVLWADASGRDLTNLDGAAFRAATVDLERRLAALAPMVCAALEVTFSRLSSQGALTSVLGELVGLTRMAGGEAISFLYQYSKEPLERHVVASAHRAGGEKIAGRGLRWATQFFTDDYLVRALTREALAPIERDISPARLRVLDPACGAGNFLVKAFDRLVSAQPGLRTVETALAETLVGYDIEQVLAELTSLQLVVRATAALKRPPEARPRCFHGEAGDERGSLLRSGNPLSPVIDEGDLRVFITNPPFLGRRLMSSTLREYLRAEYPLAKNDLCAAFVLRCLEWLRGSDRAALVHQTNWMYLSSFAPLRARLSKGFALEHCTDLGANAFADLRGEKARVGLSVFVIAPPTEASEGAAHDVSQDVGTFVGLADHDLEGKRRMLEDGARAPSSQRPPDLRSFSASVSAYGDFANPMQGTSTGDNTRYVRWSWQVSADESDYRPVSKGGGHCKWRGLNRSVVRWGQAGEMYRSLPGAALRNAERMTSTALVFSDTGMLGLNVRVLLPGQVFIASGPGIEVRVGHPLAHLAFLNSRAATVLLRTLTPKLTTSAGYIRRLPCPEAIVHDATLAQWAESILTLREATLRTQLTNDEHVSPPALSSGEGLVAAADRRLLESLRREAQVLEYEAAIEARVLEHLPLPSDDKRALSAKAGSPASMLPPRRITEPMEALDRLLASCLDLGCRHRARRDGPSGIGTSGPLEAMAKSLDVAPRTLLTHLETRTHQLPATRALFVADLLHQHTLRALGVSSDRRWEPRLSPIKAVMTDLQGQHADCHTELSSVLPDLLSTSLENWLFQIFPELHRRVFHGVPIVVREGDQLRTQRAL